MATSVFGIWCLYAISTADSRYRLNIILCMEHMNDNFFSVSTA